MTGYGIMYRIDNLLLGQCLYSQNNQSIVSSYNAN